MKTFPTASGIRSAWKHLRPFLPQHSNVSIGSVGALSFIGSVAESTVLVILTLIANSLIAGDDNISFRSFNLDQGAAAAVASVLVLVRVVCILAAASISSRFAAAVTGKAQREIVSAYLGSSYVARSARPPGDLTTVLVNHGRFTGDLAGAFALVAASVCGLVAFGGISAAVNPLATLAIAALGIAVLLSMAPLRGRSQRSSNEFTAEARLLGQRSTEMEALNTEIQLFDVGRAVQNALDRRVEQGTTHLKRLRFLGTSIPQLFQTAMLAAAIGAVIFMVRSADGNELASIGAVVLLLIRSMSSAQQYVAANQRIIEQSSYAVNVTELLSDLSVDPPSFGHQNPQRLTPLRIDDLSFSYDGSANVLRNINLEFEQGELVGLAGPSGAGKSTLVELILRLRTPSEGRMAGDDVSWEDVEPSNFAERVAFVPQRPVLIEGTVAENIDMYRGLDEDRLSRALAEAHLADEVAALPDGIHTRLGHDDRSLSGGQRQRLTIARALAGDPEIIVLDEPTSALDTISEIAIRKTLSEQSQNRLTILIAHRFSTLSSCTRIVVLEHGEVRADGHPDEVARQSGYFRKMQHGEADDPALDGVEA